MDNDIALLVQEIGFKYALQKLNRNIVEVA